MYHVQARNNDASEFKNVTIAATPLADARARMARLKARNPQRQYRICSDGKPAAEQQVKVVGNNVIIDNVSYRIPKQLSHLTTEQLIGFYKGWHPRS